MQSCMIESLCTWSHYPVLTCVNKLSCVSGLLRKVSQPHVTEELAPVISSDTRDNCHAALHSEYHNQSLSQILCYILHLHSVSEITWRMNISESTLKRPPSLCLQRSYLRAIDNIYPRPVVQAHDTVTMLSRPMTL